MNAEIKTSVNAVPLNQREVQYLKTSVKCSTLKPGWYAVAYLKISVICSTFKCEMQYIESTIWILFVYIAYWLKQWNSEKQWKHSGIKALMLLWT